MGSSLGLFASGVAVAGIPTPPNCTIPAYIDLVGCNSSGVVDPRGAFTVIMRDLDSTPFSGARIDIVFDGEVCIYDSNGGYVEPRRVHAIADVNGVATFDISGAGRNTGGDAARGQTDAGTLGLPA